MNDKEYKGSVIFSGGPNCSQKVTKFIDRNDLIVAADSGLDNALKLGITPDILIGDLDSISDSGLTWVRENQIESVKYSKDKDKSDMELAIEYASANSNSVLLIDSGLGRVDQLFGLFALLGSDKLSSIDCQAIISNTLITVVRESRQILKMGTGTVSLFAHMGDAIGVSTSGFRWELSSATLKPNSTLGLSNELEGALGEIKINSGMLLVIQPNIF